MKQDRISSPQAQTSVRAFTRKQRLASGDWKDLAGIFADASPAVKEALRLMREARYAD